jgi:hypothetical protein
MSSSGSLAAADVANGVGRLRAVPPQLGAQELGDMDRGQGRGG